MEMIKFATRCMICVPFVASALSGCVSTETIRPDDLPLHAGNEIVVTKTDGRQIRFSKSDYSIDSTNSWFVLRGTGREFTDESHAYTRPFRDSISIVDMASIEVRQRSIFYYSGPIIFVALASLFILILVTWAAAGGGGMGG
jgi:hypothetical protein